MGPKIMNISSYQQLGGPVLQLVHPWLSSKQEVCRKQYWLRKRNRFLQIIMFYFWIFTSVVVHVYV